MERPRKKKKTTINDIAEMAGTSKTTVSFYLNGKTSRMSAATRDSIKRAIDKTGYRPSPAARGLNAKETKLIGVITGDVTNTFSNLIVKGVEDVANQAGYRVLISSSNRDATQERAYIDRLLAVGVDGFIVQPTEHYREIAQVIERAGKQLVFFDSKFYDVESSWVKTDNYHATHEAVCACIEKGYRRFILVGAPAHLLSSRIERTQGFADALDAKHIGFKQHTLPDNSVDEEALKRFLRREIDGKTPTLVFAPNCWALPSVYVSMREFYPLMPDHVGLLGFDNPDWAHVASPSVSVIEQPAREEGRQACKILLDLISGANELGRRQELSCTTVWGATTR